MRKINISSKLSFIISTIVSFVFVTYFTYKGFMVYSIITIYYVSNFDSNDVCNIN